MTVRPQFQGEHIDSMLKRFKKGTQQEGLLAEIRRASTYASKAERRRLKASASRQRILRATARAAQ